MMGPRYQRIDLPAFFGEGVGPVPDRSQKGNAEAEFHRVIPVRPIFCPRPGSSWEITAALNDLSEVDFRYRDNFRYRDMAASVIANVSENRVS